MLFDQFADGDPYGDETYTKIFRQILSAVKKKNSIRVLYPLKNGTEKWIKCNPVRLEYSLRDDKFRLISVYKGRINTISVSKIIQCETIGSFRTAKIKEEVHDKRTVELLVQDERQALERVMMQFSIYQKATERIEENSYRITLTYEAEDEIDLMIQILSFGTSLKVAGGSLCGTDKKQIRDAETLRPLRSQRFLHKKGVAERLYWDSSKSKLCL